MKPINPYTRLLEQFRDYVTSVKYPNQTRMFHIGIETFGSGLTLTDIHERTIAANTLGYDVILKADSLGIDIDYRKRPMKTPWQV